MLKLGNMQITNPIVASSGALAYGRAYGWERPLNVMGIVKPDIIGAVITKTLTIKPRKGNYHGWNPWQVLAPLKGGWVNAFGLTNPGIDWFIESEYPKVSNHNLIVSISGENPDNIIAMVQKLRDIDILGIEINLSCPNTPEWIKWQENIGQTMIALKGSVFMSRHPIIVKIGYLDDDNREEMLYAIESSGVEVIDMINTIPYNKLYPNKKSPLNFGGGVSGNLIKEYALEQVRWFSSHSKLPIIGGGGVEDIFDVGNFLEAGASAVSIGSAHILHPWITTSLVENYYLKD